MKSDPKLNHICTGLVMCFLFPEDYTYIEYVKTTWGEWFFPNGGDPSFKNLSFGRKFLK